MTQPSLIQPLIALLILALIAVLLALVLWPGSGLYARWRRAQRLDERVLIEDALKHLYGARLRQRKPTLQSLAGAANISADRAAQLVERLTELELVQLVNGDIRLTPEGETYALNVLRAHRLWERYLAEKTGFAESEWHERADWVEHTLSEDDLAALSSELGHPMHDPHGDPIPTAEGDLVYHGGKPLNGMAPDKPLQIVHLEDEPEAVYAQLMAEGLYPGMRLQVLDVSPTRIRFWADGKEHVLAPIAAANVSVRALPAAEAVDDTPSRHLDSLQPGESAKVIRLSSRCRGMERRRLLDLGILPGTKITAELISPSGDPIAYRIRGALIALRKQQARLIDIEHPTGEAI